MNIRKLIIEDVRCFAGRQEFEIRPITFLVGENSTGKSTALACLQTLNDFLSVPLRGLDFNAEPYNLGAFADIVRISRPKKSSFQLGIELESQRSGTIQFCLTMTERGAGSEPVAQDLRMLFADRNEILFEKNSQQESRSKRRPQVEIREKPDGRKQFVIASPFSNLGGFEQWSPLLPYYAEGHGGSLSPEARELKRFLAMRKEIFYPENFPPVYSFAPIRSKPQRTYDLLREGIALEGSDMPMVLMNIVRRSGARWDTLRDRLIRFGRSSGLFADVNVRKLGGSTSDPFQLQINVRGPKVNLMDVGYGVNQILPILVCVLRARRKEATFLMQQPEVHLHPRAQAELSSLLIEIAKQRKQNFVIETHSDYMIDRASVDIRGGRIPHEHVSLIYLEPRRRDVQVHNIKFDEQGNLLDAPSSYRQFFLEESDRFLGFDED